MYIPHCIFSFILILLSIRFLYVYCKYRRSQSKTIPEKLALVNNWLFAETFCILYLIRAIYSWKMEYNERDKERYPLY